MDRYDFATIAVVLVLVTSQAGMVLAADLTHDATAGVTYETNSGLEVELGDDREVEATPFDDDATFSDQGIEISSPGPDAAVVINDATYAGDSMSVSVRDDTDPVTFERDDGLGPLTVQGGASSVVVHDFALDDETVDFEIAATSETDVTVPVPDVDGVQVVNDAGTVIAGDADTADGEVTFEIPSGTHALRLQDGPSTLEVRDLIDQELITEDENGDPIELEIQFFGDDGAVEQRTTTDGVVDMAGLPIDERFAVNIDGGDEFVQRQILIPSLLQQQRAFLLPQDVDIETVEPRFEIEDPTGEFDQESSEIFLERPIDANGGTEFVAVTGDRVGINGFAAILERDQRYRVTISNPETGATRQLGEFTPVQSETVTLTVEDIEFDSVADVDGLEWTARLIEEDNSNAIEFIYRDQFETQSIDYRIVERGDENNVLVDGTAGGNVTVTEPLTDAQADRVWQVEWEATRTNGETLSATRPVSTDRLPVGPPEFPERWQVIVSMLALFGVAGLFGAANPGIGGIAVASTGGFLFLAGWLPDETGGLMVVLALFIAALSYAARRARGAQA